MGFYQSSIPPTSPQTNLSGQTIIITGATAGLGREASLQLLRLRASTVILGVRNTIKGNAVRAQLLADEEVRRVNGQADVKVLRLDLADYASVVEFADRVIREIGSLDVLLLNAGINLARFERSVSGHEMCMQVNFLSNALLSLLLLPLLKKTSHQLRNPTDPTRYPTITWVGSIAQSFNSLARYPISPMDPILSHFSDPLKYSRLFRYSDTKFLVALFVREMAKHVPCPDGENPGLMLNNICPGTVDTAADNDLPFWLRIPMNLHRKLRARTVEEGARTLVYAAVIAGKEARGGFMADNEIRPLAPYADTPEGLIFAERLWKETVDECTKVDGRVRDSLSL